MCVHITTVITEGSVHISVDFQIGTPIDRAVTDVRDAVAKVRSDLPQAILEPQCRPKTWMAVHLSTTHSVPPA